MILLPLPRRYAREIKGMSQRGDYEIPAVGVKEAFWGVIYILEGILPMDKIK